MRTCQYGCSHLMLEFLSAPMAIQSQESGCTHPELPPDPQTLAPLSNPVGPQSHPFIHGLLQINKYQPRSTESPQIPHRQRPLVLVCFCDEVLKGERVYLDSQLIIVPVTEAAGHGGSRWHHSQSRSRRKQTKCWCSAHDLLPVVKMAVHSLDGCL